MEHRHDVLVAGDLVPSPFARDLKYSRSTSSGSEVSTFTATTWSSDGCSTVIHHFGTCRAQQARYRGNPLLQARRRCLEANPRRNFLMVGARCPSLLFYPTLLAR